jgi:predicted dehydrogenase
MPVKYGIIGCGSIARHRHIPEAAANPDSRIVAVCDPVPGRAAEVAAKYDTKAFTDHKEMLATADIDAVVVCGPNSLHAPQSISAMEAGKHVLVEKPMATTRAEAKAMIAAAKKAKKFLMVGQNQRLMPAHQKAKEILDSGCLGKVLTFRTSFKHRGPDGWSIDGAKSWFFQKEAAVMGVTGDLGVHKADLMRWLLGQEFTQVSAIISTLDKRTPDGKLLQLDDNAFLLLKTTGGITGSVEISWTNYGMEDNMTVVYCQKGVLYLGTDREYGVIVQYRNGNKDLHKVGAMATNTKQVTSGVIDAFTASILKNRRPKIDGMEGYRSLDVILTAMEAAAAGQTLKIAK